MNEEERFVIKTLKDSQNTYIENTKVKKVELSTDEAKVVLNLIEKQQKELEQIEKEHKEENGRLREEVKKYETMIINHKKQLSKSGIYGYDYDLKILEESEK